MIGDAATLPRVPVIKLPPPRFMEVMLAVAEGDGSRADATRRVLPLFPPGSSEKNVMRALVIPSLTRFHFARSNPPRLDLAPNGVVWKETEPSLRPAYTGLVLRDLLVVHLQMPPRLADPAELRSDGKTAGARTEDRVSGYARYLEAFPAPRSPDPGDVSALPVTLGRNGLPLARALDTARASIRGILERGDMVGWDRIRTKIMRDLLSGGWVVTSFTVDALLVDLIPEGDVFLPVLSGTNSLEVLIYAGRPYAAARRVPQ